MNLIVFGGSGFIGNALLNLPELKKYELLVVTRDPKNIKKFADKGIQAIVWDYESDNQIKPYFQGNYAIVNLAGENIGRIWTRSRKKRILESRLKILHHLSNLINSSVVKPVVFLQASAAGYYGNRGETEITEKTGKGEGFLSDVADTTEKTLVIKSEKTRIIFIRSGIVLGKRGGFLKRLFIPFKLYVGGHFGNGKQWMSWIHRHDELRAIAFLLDKHDAKGVYNLCSPDPIRMKAFCNIFGRVLYRPSWFHIPAFLLKLFLGRFADELILISQRLKPQRLIEAGFQFEFPDLKEALEEIYYEND